MNFVKNYINYLRDNPRDYWFKRKLYGWGWVPARWQGLVIIAAFIIFIFWDRANPPGVLLAVLLLLYICYRTGEPPRWQWGRKKDHE